MKALISQHPLGPGGVHCRGWIVPVGPGDSRGDEPRLDPRLEPMPTFHMVGDTHLDKKPLGQNASSVMLREAMMK
jgi:hypothetical protein